MLKKVLGLLMAAMMLTQPVYAIAEGIDASVALPVEQGEAGEADAQQNKGTGGLEEIDAPGALLFTVRFLDWDGTALASQTVEEGSGATAPGIPSREGYAFIGWDKDFSAITGDLDVTAVYAELQTYTVTIEYMFLNTHQTAAQPFVAAVIAGSSLQQTVVSPTIAGFTPDLAEVALDFTDISKDEHQVVYYAASMGTQYFVKHLKEQLNGSYALADTDPLTGETGSTATAIAKSYEGFTAQAQMPSAAIAADGSTILEVKYTRNQYTLVYATGGSYIRPEVRSFEEALIAPSDPTRPGYVFRGWFEDAAFTEAFSFEQTNTMPARNLTLHAKWEKGDPVKYTEVYWLENATSEGYGYVGSVEKTGYAGDAPALPSGRGGLTFPIGDAYNTRNAQKTATENAAVRIKGDGTTVVNIYYDRNTYTITFKLNGGSMAFKGITYNDSKNYVITAKYGANIGDKWPSVLPAKQGKKFVHWDSDQNSSNYVTTHYYMDDLLAGATLTAIWENDVAKLKISYYFENLPGVTTGESKDGRYYTLGDSQEVQHSTQSGSWNAKVFEGFTVLPGTSPVSIGSKTEIKFYYTRNKYSITYHDRGVLLGTAEYYYQQGTVGRAVPQNGPDGYYFEGWYLSEDGFGAYTFGAMPAYNVILYAKWAPIKYPVTFDANGGSAVGSQSIPMNNAAASPDTPARPGYVFGGWYYKEVNGGFGLPYSFDTLVQGPVELIAKWVPSTSMRYTVRYINGVTNLPVDPDKVVAGQTTGTTVTEEAPPINSFLPDRVSKSLTISGDEAGNVITFIYTPMTVVSYTVKYLRLSDDVVLYPTETKQTGNVIVTENYRAIGGYSPDYYQKSLMLSTAGVNEIVFYYTPNQNAAYRVEHYLQNLSGGGYGKADADELIEAPIGSMTQTAAELQKTFEGHVFSLALSTAAKPVASSGTVMRLYYPRIQYTVTFHRGLHGSIPLNLSVFSGIRHGTPFGDAVTVPNPTVDFGYVFTGWSAALPAATSPVVSNHSYTAQYEKNLALWHTVSYNGNGATNGASMPASGSLLSGTAYTILVNEFERQNHTFTGWNTAANGSGTAYAAGAAFNVDATVTLYAQWAENGKFAVTYHGNGASAGSTVDADSPYYAGNVTVKENGFTRPGYSFNGWNTEADGSGAAYAPHNTLTIAAHVNLYAQWVKANEEWATVTFNANGGTGSMAPIEYLKAEAQELPLNAFTREHHDFLGWATSANGPIVYEDQGVVPANTGSQTLYAVWLEHDRYAVTYYGNGGTGGAAPVDTSIYYLNDTATVLDKNTLIREHAVFLGWYESALALMTAAPAELLSREGDALSMAASVTLYAVWAADADDDGIPDYEEFTVTYHANGADAGTAPVDGKLYYEEPYTAMDNTGGLIKTGYTFGGWNAKPDGTGTAIAVGSVNPIDQNVDLYAVWQLNTYAIGYEGLEGSTFEAVNPNPVSYTVEEGLITLQNPEKEGYTFLGWTLNGGDDLLLTAVIEPSSTGDKLFTAQWKIKTYTITFLGLDGEVLKTEPVEHGSGATAPADPQYENYDFTGWDKAFGTITSDLTVNALLAPTPTPEQPTPTPGGGGPIDIPDEEVPLGPTPAPTTPVPTVTPAPTAAPAAPVRTATPAPVTPAPTTTPATPAPTATPATPATQAPAPTPGGLIDIPDGTVPLEAMPEGKGEDLLTLVDLVSMIVTVIGTLALLLKKKDKKDDEEAQAQNERAEAEKDGKEQSGFKRIGTRVIAALMSVASAVLFILTQPLKPFDIWDNRTSLWMLLFLAVYVAMALIARKKKQKDENEADAA